MSKTEGSACVSPRMGNAPTSHRGASMARKPASVSGRMVYSPPTKPAMREALSGPQFYFATIFADVQPTEQHMQTIIKDRVSAKLYELADPANNRNADKRVKALAALAELYGLHQPVSFTLPTLDELDAEIARRKAL
jgi:hypothetical protein